MSIDILCQACVAKVLCGIGTGLQTVGKNVPQEIVEKINYLRFNPQVNNFSLEVMQNTARAELNKKNTEVKDLCKI